MAARGVQPGVWMSPAVAGSTVSPVKDPQNENIYSGGKRTKDLPQRREDAKNRKEDGYDFTITAMTLDDTTVKSDLSRHRHQTYI
jgi:hypothetical protein